ncbi:hypothetical protein [Longitalea luteola]|nr:hypothetical protein [Longitalea luteola]
MLPVTGYQLCQLPVTSYRLPVTGYREYRTMQAAPLVTGDR